jgi:hypothetical protein
MVRCQNAGVTKVDEPWRCDKASDPGDELERLEHEVGGTLAGVLQSVRDLAGEREPHALEAHRRAKQVAAQPFEGGAVVGLDDDAGFEVEPPNVRRELLGFRRFEQARAAIREFDLCVVGEPAQSAERRLRAR